MAELYKKRPIEDMNYYDWLDKGKDFIGKIHDHMDEMRIELIRIREAISLNGQCDTDYMKLLFDESGILNRIEQIKGLDSAGLWVNELPPKCGGIYTIVRRHTWDTPPCEYDIDHVRWIRSKDNLGDGFYVSAHDAESKHPIDPDNIMCHARLFYIRDHGRWPKDVTTKLPEQAV